MDVASFPAWICGGAMQAQCVPDFQKFEDFLGVDKAKMLKSLNSSFETALHVAYPNRDNTTQRYEAFLQHFRETNRFPQSFFNDSLEFRKLQLEIEASGLRKELYLSEGEVYPGKWDLNHLLPLDLRRVEVSKIPDNLNLDSIDLELRETYPGLFDNIYPARLEPKSPVVHYRQNAKGMFYYGIGKYACSAKIMDYLDIVNDEFNISLGVIANGILAMDLKNIFVRQIVIGQFFILAILNFESLSKLN